MSENLMTLGELKEKLNGYDDSLLIYVQTFYFTGDFVERCEIKKIDDEYIEIIIN